MPGNPDRNGQGGCSTPSSALHSERSAFRLRQHQKTTARRAQTLLRAFGPPATQTTLQAAAKLRWDLKDEDAAAVAGLVAEIHAAGEAEIIHLTLEETMEDATTREAVRQEIRAYLLADVQLPVEEAYNLMKERTGTCITLGTFRSYIYRERNRPRTSDKPMPPAPVLNAVPLAEVDRNLAPAPAPASVPPTTPTSPRVVLPQPNPMVQTVTLLKARKDHLQQELQEIDAVIAYLTRASLEN